MPLDINGLSVGDALNDMINLPVAGVSSSLISTIRLFIVFLKANQNIFVRGADIVSVVR